MSQSAHSSSSVKDPLFATIVQYLLPIPVLVRSQCRLKGSIGMRTCGPLAVWDHIFGTKIYFLPSPMEIIWENQYNFPVYIYNSVIIP